MNASIGQFGQNYKKLKLPELSFSSIVCRKELGEAYYGVVYLADVLPNLLYSPNHPCAAKVRIYFNFKVAGSYEIFLKNDYGSRRPRFNRN